MMGIPASRAFCTESRIASTFGTEMARPSTFCETAASISCASFWGSLLAGLQMSLTPSSLAACSAPFLTTDQNEPSSLWVTIANVRSLPWGRATSSAFFEDELDDLDELLSLDDPQPATSRATTATSR